VNRNKKSIAVDLKHSEGRRVLLDLAARSDVLVENFRVGTMERLGLGYEELRAVNPGLIYCSVTGFGREGPYRDLPGYDPVVQALGGLMSITGPPDGEPYKVGVGLVDVLAGLFCSTAITAALRWRDAHGQGQRIDTSLLDVQLASLVYVASGYLVTGEPPKRYGNDHPNIAPFGTLPTSDGYVMLAIGNDAQWQRFCETVGHGELVSDPDFESNEQRVRNRDRLIEVLSEISRRRSSREWFDLLMPTGVPVAPIESLGGIFSDPHVSKGGLVETLQHPLIGEFRAVGSPLMLSGSRPATRYPPPLLGEHTEAVLTEVLGYSQDRISDLAGRKVIGGPGPTRS
jgi:formyl-CoA transferase